MNKTTFALLGDYCERCGVKRTEAAVESMFSVVHGFSNNAIPRTPSIFFSIWLMKQETIIFDHVIDIRDKPGYPARFEENNRLRNKSFKERHGPTRPGRTEIRSEPNF